MADYSGWENVLSGDIKNLIDNYFNDVKPGEVIYDVGANVGAFSNEILERYKDTRLILFEPVKDFYQHLKEKFAENKNVSVFNFAFLATKLIKSLFPM